MGDGNTTVVEDPEFGATLLMVLSFEISDIQLLKEAGKRGEPSRHIGVDRHNTICRG